MHHLTENNLASGKTDTQQNRHCHLGAVGIDQAADEVDRQPKDGTYEFVVGAKENCSFHRLLSTAASIKNKSQMIPQQGDVIEGMVKVLTHGLDTFTK